VNSCADSDDNTGTLPQAHFFGSKPTDPPSTGPFLRFAIDRAGLPRPARLDASTPPKLDDDEPPIGVFLKTIPVRGKGTLLDTTHRWIAAGTKLGKLETRREEQEAKRRQRLRQGSPILQGKPSRALLAVAAATEKPRRRAPPNLAQVILAAHLRRRDVVASSAAAGAVATHATSNDGLRARAIGGANGGSPRCARIATTTSRSEISPTIARRPPQGQARTSSR